MSDIITEDINTENNLSNIDTLNTTSYSITAKLSEVKKERKRIELEKQELVNRIKLLETEDKKITISMKKAWEETRKILNIKKQELTYNNKLESLIQKYNKQLSIKKNKLKELKQNLNESLLETKSKNLNNKIKLADEVRVKLKQLKEINKEKKENERNEIIKKCEIVKQFRKQAATAKENLIKSKKKKYNKEYLKEISKEKSIKSKFEEEIDLLAKKEKELLERLRSNQLKKSDLDKNIKIDLHNKNFNKYSNDIIFE